MLNRCAHIIFAFLFGLLPAKATELTQLWSIEGQFNMPESAAYDAKRGAVYLSNVNHYAKDNNGFISRISEDGKQVEVQWLTGLHSPTGLAVKEDTLYAVDFDALVIIDLNQEQIVARIPAEDAQQSPVLNDVAIAPGGEIFVSGSRSRTIYKRVGSTLEVWLKDDTQLKKANGLWVNEDYVIHGGEHWTAFDINSKQPVQAWSLLGKGLVDIDGITADGRGGFIATLINDQRLWSIGHGRSAIPLSEDVIGGIDLQYFPEKQLLFVPRVGNSLSAYTLSF